MTSYRLKMFGTAILALIIYLLIVLPVVLLLISFVIINSFIMIYMHTFNFLANYLFKLDKLKEKCYNKSNSTIE